LDAQLFKEALHFTLRSFWNGPRSLTRRHGPGIISDNGPQFIAKDFQGVHSDLGHDPSQNIALLASIEGKIERWHKSLKGECIRPGTPLTLKMHGVLWRVTSSITTMFV